MGKWISELFYRSTLNITISCTSSFQEEEIPLSTESLLISSFTAAAFHLDLCPSYLTSLCSSGWKIRKIMW